MKAVRLRTSYLENPLGINQETPHFSWNCEGGKMQTAYQIIATCDGEIIWDSGVVTSSTMTQVGYEGKALKSRKQVEWAVNLWDENQEKGEPACGSFELGLMDSFDWNAKWIAGDYRPKKGIRYPVDYFRKTLRLKNQIKKARLYASARGVYDVRIDGTRLEDFILAPGITDYRKRIQYQTYDVTKRLAENSVLEICLGDGWYRGSVAAYGVTNVYGTQTSVMAQLEIEYEDGTKETIGTDGSWQWSNDGPIRFADLKDGEVYDASRIPSYSGKAEEVKGPEAQIVASNNVAVTEHETFEPKEMVAKDGTTVLDFGQNIAGYLSFTLKEDKGKRIRLICGEILDADGKVDLSGIQESRPVKGWSQMSLIKKLMTGQISGESNPTPRQEILFTCSGEQDQYKTSFAVFGFRYVQVESDFDIHTENFHAIAVYSNMEQTGDFQCSDDRINKLVENTRWSMKGNFLDVPTDCPTRERLGWTGDAQIFFETGAYFMNTAPFFGKWIQDMEDAQYKNGLLPAVLPYNGVEMMYKSTGSSVGWADAIYLVPYRYYKMYGDLEILKKFWPMMKKYADYLMTNLGLTDKKKAKENPENSYTYEKGIHLGEWLEPEKFKDQEYGAKAKHPEECTAYLSYAMDTISEIAELVQEHEYAATLKQYGDGAKRAYLKFAELDSNRQAKLVRPLALGLLSGEMKAKAREQLKQAVIDYDYCVGTGFLSTAFLLPVLTEAGETETAYKMLLNTKKPSWLGEVLDGATTIWEDWEGKNSQNHYSPGAVCQWMFDTIAGIRVDGKNHFRITPTPGGNLEHASACYRSIYGEVKSSWRVQEDKVHFTIEIPANTEAEVVLPDGSMRLVGAGVWEY